MPDKPVRVRIAPSPSGYLHVGTARSAIFNYLFARHHDGKFLIRIEDTDVERSKADLIEPILSALQWLGIESDEEIVYQSKRLDHYKTFSNKLIDSGHAYYCFCSKEQLAEDRAKAQAEKGDLRYNRRCANLTKEEVESKLADGLKPVCRIRIPDGVTKYNDIVSGELSRNNNEIEDFIIARSDDSATYNLAVVIDDHEMNISHVIRGNDHITNTFKQIHIYNALGYELPVFGHIPLILRPDKKKVSKRLGDKDINEYKTEGYLPEAMFNYLSLLGWSPKTDQEIYTQNELIEIFNEDNLNSSNAIFDVEKLTAFNHKHIQFMNGHDIASYVVPLLVENGIQSKYWFETRWEYAIEVMDLLKERAKMLNDFVDLTGYFFEYDYTYDEKAEEKAFGGDSVSVLDSLKDKFKSLSDFSHDPLEKALAETAEELGFKKGKLIHPTRLAVSGRSTGPGLYEMLAVLGKDSVIDRMEKAIEYIKNK